MNNFLWCIIACMAWGMCPLLEALSIIELDVSVAIFIQSFTIAVLSGIYVLTSSSVKEINSVFSENGLKVILIVFSAVIGNLLGRYAYFQSISGEELTSSVAISSCYPLITAILGVIFLREKLHLKSCSGLALIVFGVYIFSI